MTAKTENARLSVAMNDQPEVVILIGIQAVGKSTFCRQHLYNTHVIINLDTLKTRHREAQVYASCLRVKFSCAIDNTNLTPNDRHRYIAPARAAGYRVIGYYFQSCVSEALRHNQARRNNRVSDRAILWAHKRLILPTVSEGFDALRYVAKDQHGGFVIQEWIDQ